MTDEDLLKDFCCMQQEADWMIIGAICLIVLEERNYDIEAKSADAWLESTMALKKFVSQLAAVLQSSFNF